jgi:hypothetical protein
MKALNKILISLLFFFAIAFQALLHAQNNFPPNITGESYKLLLHPGFARPYFSAGISGGLYATFGKKSEPERRFQSLWQDPAVYDRLIERMGGEVFPSLSGNPDSLNMRSGAMKTLGFRAGLIFPSGWSAEAAVLSFGRKRYGEIPVLIFPFQNGTTGDPEPQSGQLGVSIRERGWQFLLGGKRYFCTGSKLRPFTGTALLLEAYTQRGAFDAGGLETALFEEPFGFRGGIQFSGGIRLEITNRIALEGVAEMGISSGGIRPGGGLSVQTWLH